MANVTIYGIHGSYGYGCQVRFLWDVTMAKLMGFLHQVTTGGFTTIGPVIFKNQRRSPGKNIPVDSQSRWENQICMGYLLFVLKHTFMYCVPCYPMLIRTKTLRHSYLWYLEKNLPVSDEPSNTIEITDKLVPHAYRHTHTWDQSLQ